MKYALAWAILLLCPAAYADLELRFGVYASDKPTVMVKKFRPILNRLETRLTEKLQEPVRIRLQVASNYDRGIDDIVSGRVDFARMGPASFITSMDLNPGLKLLAMESKNGKKTFFGIICVGKESPIWEINQLKGKSFAFGNQHSTIGRYLAQSLLRKNGLYAYELRAYEYLGRHDRVGHAVGAGQFDAGALKESTFKKLLRKGVKIRELVRFPVVTKPWIASSDVNRRVTTALRESLLQLKDPAALSALKKDGFLPATGADYALIRESMQKNAEFFTLKDEQ